MTQQVRDDGGAVIPVLRPGTVQKVIVGATSVATASAFGGGAEVVRIAPSVDCHFALGASPTATATDHYLPAGALEFISVRAGEKLAFIRAASLDGIVTVSEME